MTDIGIIIINLGELKSQFSVIKSVQTVKLPHPITVPDPMH